MFGNQDFGAGVEGGLEGAGWSVVDGRVVVVRTEGKAVSVDRNLVR